ncbi:hypothetical protein [Saliniramus fredricksonii]|nr:hypothetical protein [Saliniramus fredricksonii]
MLRSSGIQAEKPDCAALALAGVLAESPGCHYFRKAFRAVTP